MITPTETTSGAPAPRRRGRPRKAEKPAATPAAPAVAPAPAYLAAVPAGGAWHYLAAKTGDKTTADRDAAHRFPSTLAASAACQHLGGYPVPA